MHRCHLPMWLLVCGMGVPSSWHAGAMAQISELGNSKVGNSEVETNADREFTSFRLDPQGSPTSAGFNSAFHSPEGTMFLNEWNISIEPFGQPGHQRFGLAYSTENVVNLEQNTYIRGPRLRLRPTISALRRALSTIGAVVDPDRRPDDWMFYYNFDQYLFTEDEDPTQGVGLFDRFGWSDGESNPVAQFYSIGVGGKGIIPTRDQDTFGLGYYYIKTSDKIPELLGISSEQGIELYYRIEVTPWLHISPDLQVIIDKGKTTGHQEAVVFGLRTHLTF